MTRTSSSKVVLHRDLRAFFKRAYNRVIGEKQLCSSDEIQAEVLTYVRELVKSTIRGDEHGCPWEGPPFNLEILASLWGHTVEERVTLFSEDAELHPNPAEPWLETFRLLAQR